MASKNVFVTDKATPPKTTKSTKVKKTSSINLRGGK